MHILIDGCLKSNSEARGIRWLVLVLGNHDRRRYSFNHWAQDLRDELLSSGEWIERETQPGQVEILHRCMAMT